MNDIEAAIASATAISLAALKSGQEIGRQESAERIRILTDALETIAGLHENYEDRSVGERSALLYDARCVAREVLRKASIE